MDVLSDILDTVSVRGQVYFRTCFNTPWSIAVPAFGRAVRFHYVIQGECILIVPGEPSVTLGPGDLVLVPCGAAHRLSDPAGDNVSLPECMLADHGYTGIGDLHIGAGDDSTATRMICGHFTFGEGSDHPLLRALPPYLLVSALQRADSFWLDEALGLMTRQISAGSLGAASVVRRISEVIFIEAIRAGADQSPNLSRMMRALSDPRISRALAAIHGSPGTNWSVEKLASAAAMSRSRFAELFQALVGFPPMAYLTEWRMQRARALLAESPRNIKEIANTIGYSSAAAFSRAFLDRFGEPPIHFRKRHMA